MAWSDRQLPPHCRVDNTEQNPVNATGLYLYDAFGNLNLLYRDPAISSLCPIPVRAAAAAAGVCRARSPGTARRKGASSLQDVYAGLDGRRRAAAIKRLRIVGVPPKIAAAHEHARRWASRREDPGKFVLGTVPVEADGSAYFRVPVGRAGASSRPSTPTGWPCRRCGA